MEIRARVKAVLKTQNYAEGSVVKAGQVLFTLDDREYQAKLEQVKAKLTKGDADLAQAENKTVTDAAEATGIEAADAGCDVLRAPLLDADKSPAD